MFLLYVFTIPILIICCKSDEPESTDLVGSANMDQVSRSNGQYPNSQTLFEQGRTLQARAEFVRAEEKYRQASTLEPQNAQYHFRLGTVLHAQSRYGEAKNSLLKSLSLKVDYAAPRIALAKLLYDIEGKVDTAQILLREAISLAPQSDEARYTLGLIFLREGSPRKAIETFSDLVKNDSTNSKARMQLGFSFFQANQLDEAKFELDKVAESFPYEGSIYNALGQINMRLENIPTGRAFLERARALEEEDTQLQPLRDTLRQYPNHPQAYYNLATMYARFGRLRISAEHFSQAISLDTTYSPAYLGLGNLFQRLGSTPETRTEYAKRALAYYSKALALNPASAETHNNLGLMLLNSENTGKALSHFEKAVNLQPNTGFYVANLGFVQYKLGKHGIAIETLNRALMLDSTLYAAHETLGDIALYKKDIEVALGHWQAIPEKNIRGNLRKKIENAQQTNR
ncbi:MAG: tetratricopeptide repeat protein [Candidatus Latescibacterota bacterium]|nr:tetratricopeptide repeat protein [Candidatus Latescibacterota bacterium]